MRTLFLLLTGLVLTACGGAKEEPAASTVEATIVTVEINAEPSASYDEAHAAAVAAIQLAADKGHAWNTADNLIDEAIAAAANGDESLALTLADEARIQALLAAVQADREAAAWRGRVVTD